MGMQRTYCAPVGGLQEASVILLGIQNQNRTFVDFGFKFIHCLTKLYVTIFLLDKLAALMRNLLKGVLQKGVHFFSKMKNVSLIGI